MTEQQLCKNCKHLEHDGGCGIWCGVHGNNRNYDCPKFERKYEVATESNKMSEKEIQPIAMDGKIIDFKTKEVIEDLDAKNKKRFTICVDSNNLKSLWDDERTEEEPLLWLTRSDRIGGIDDVCKLLNELHDEKKQLHRVIEENEKMIQSTYEELSKLRLIKKNLRNIKNQWNWIMESVDYD